MYWGVTLLAFAAANLEDISERVRARKAISIEDRCIAKFFNSDFKRTVSNILRIVSSDSAPFLNVFYKIAISSS